MERVERTEMEVALAPGTPLVTETAIPVGEAAAPERRAAPEREREKGIQIDIGQSNKKQTLAPETAVPLQEMAVSLSDITLSILRGLSGEVTEVTISGSATVLALIQRLLVQEEAQANLVLGEVNLALEMTLEAAGVTDGDELILVIVGWVRGAQVRCKPRHSRKEHLGVVVAIKDNEPVILLDRLGEPRPYKLTDFKSVEPTGVTMPTEQEVTTKATKKPVEESDSSMDSSNLPEVEVDEEAPPRTFAVRLGQILRFSNPGVLAEKRRTFEIGIVRRVEPLRLLLEPGDSSDSGDSDSDNCKEVDVTGFILVPLEVKEGTEWESDLIWQMSHDSSSSDSDAHGSGSTSD